MNIRHCLDSLSLSMLVPGPDSGKQLYSSHPLATATMGLYSLQPLDSWNLILFFNGLVLAIDCPEPDQSASLRIEGYAPDGMGYYKNIV